MFRSFTIAAASAAALPLCRGLLRRPSKADEAKAMLMKTVAAIAGILGRLSEAGR